MRYLIVHDSPEKANLISNVILREDKEAKVDLAVTASEGRSYLMKNEYDISILDLHLPENDKSPANAEVGHNLMLEMSTSERMIAPRHIFGITSMLDLLPIYQEKFQEMSHSIIDTDKNWDGYLGRKIKYLTKVNKQFKNMPIIKKEVDICILTALEEEIAPYKVLLELKEFSVDGDPITYYESMVTTTSGKRLNLIICTLDTMGISATTALAMKVIYNFSPRYLCMTGICAGIEEDLSLGDLIITERSFDYSFGKIIDEKLENKTKAVFKPSQNSLTISTLLKQKIIKFKSNKTLIEHARKKIEVPIKYKDKETTLFFGSTCSGPFVVQSDTIKKMIRDMERKVLGLDMETYSLFVSSSYFDELNRPEILTIKAVCDKADEEKDDELHPYCSNLSASYMIELFKNDYL